MFTGLVREVGRLTHISRRAGITTLEIDAPLIARPPKGMPPAIGDSVAVNGICLTLVRTAGTRIAVEATAETRRVTTLAEWRIGTAVHLEPSLRVGDQLGGHFVLGHVDGTGRLEALEHRAGAAWMTIGLPAALASRLLPKGSIAVDGVSLTLDEGPFDGRFTVTLIPHTLGATRFRRLSPGARVNIELDVLAKAGTLRQAEGGVSPPNRPRGGMTVGTILARGWSRGTRDG